ncbi:MAG: CCA tRNA nucleotidyltransferase [Bacilli bacterium]
MKVPGYIKKIIKKIENNNHEAYIVGGACRDFLMGKKPIDYDLTTSALPSEIKEIFKKYKLFNYGEKHGTISIYINKNEVQVTTYRIENNYSDNRHPDKVEFLKDLKEDLSRRDFTMNAIAYNKEFIDYFNGLNDINQKNIKTVGNSNSRFEEDALRIMRALRFSVNLDFKIEEETKKGILNNYHLVKNISKERVRDELIKMLTFGDYSKVVEEYFEIFAFIFNGIQDINVDDFLENIKSVNKEKLKEADDYIIRIAIFLNLMFGYQKNDLNRVEEKLKELCFSKKNIYEILLIMENIFIKIDNDEITLKKLLNKYGYNILNKIIKSKYYFSEKLEDVIFLNKILKTIKKIERKKICYSMDSLKIDGNDLKEIGYKKREIQTVKEKLLDKVISNELKNNKKSIIKYLEENKNSIS